MIFSSYKPIVQPDCIYLDATYTGGYSDGSFARPFTTIDTAFAAIEKDGTRLFLQSDIQVDGQKIPPLNKFTIYGNGHQIWRTGGHRIFFLNSTQELTFRDITLFGEVRITGPGVLFKLDNIRMDGTFWASYNYPMNIVLNNSTLVGNANYPIPLQIGQAGIPSDGVFVQVTNSTVSGYPGADNPAVKWFSTNNIADFRWSVFKNGIAGNQPFVQTGGPYEYIALECGFEVSPIGTNKIGTPYNVIDIDL